MGVDKEEAEGGQGGGKKILYSPVGSVRARFNRKGTNDQRGTQEDAGGCQGDMAGKLAGQIRAGPKRMTESGGPRSNDDQGGEKKKITKPSTTGRGSKREARTRRSLGG